MISEFIKQLRETDVSELDFNNLGVWPLPFRILLLLGISLALFAGAYYFHIDEMNQAVLRGQNEEARLKGVFEQKAFEAANLLAYRNQMVEIEKSFNALLSQLPKDTEVPGLLEDITEMGLGSSLNIQSITLMPEVAAEYYVELPIQISATGSYHDIGSFVSGISGLPRIVTLHDYSLEAINESGVLKFEVLAKTYRYKGEEG